MSGQGHLSYRPSVDGLRAIAILSVIGFHAFPAWVPGGFVGVDIFFVISGFLISGILLENLQSNSFSLAVFYARRIRRIFPALILVLIAVMAFGYFFLWPDEYRQLAKQSAGGAGFIVNYLLAQETGYFDGKAETKPLLHLWSLGVEEQFYIFWPLMLWAAWKIRHRAGVLIMGVLALSFMINIWLATQNAAADFYSPFSRFWELMAGGLLAWSGQNKPPIASRAIQETTSCAGLALLAVAVFALNKNMNFPGCLALLPVCGAVLLIAAGENTFLNRKILAHPASLYIGAISYPLYLWHWPLLSYARILAGADLSRIARIERVALAFILAALTYHLIEQPIRKQGFKKQPILLLLALMILVGGFSLIIYIEKGLPQRYAAFGSAETDLSSDRMIAEWENNARFHMCHLQDPDENQQAAACIESTRPLLLLWGDSHAASLYPGLKHLQQAHLFGIAQLTQSSCPPLFDLPTIKDRPNCNAINDRILRQAADLKPAVIVLDSAWIRQDYPIKKEHIIEHLLDSIARIQQAAPQAKIMIVGPTPRWSSPLPALYRRALTFHHGVPPPRCNMHLDPRILPLDTAMQNAIAANGITYLSPQRQLCNADGCLSRFDDKFDSLTFLDEEHVTARASAFLADQFAPVILTGLGTIHP